MKLIHNRKILIVGLGLLGGCYAMALHRHGFHVSAITLDKESIDYALENDYIDEGADFVNERLIKEADIIVFALYPHVFIDWIEKNQHLFTPGTLLTDVTGVKSSVVYKIQDILRDDVEFIAAHPMAGKETSGVQNSNDMIFRGANYIVVPTEKNSADAIETCESLGRLLGFHKIGRLTPEEHDAVIGFVSQLTHCIAITLMNCNENDSLAEYTGDSFRDLTRIARINDEMWSELFMLNRDTLLEQMDMFEKEFDSLRQALLNGDVETLREKMRNSTKRRELFDKKL